MPLRVGTALHHHLKIGGPHPRQLDDGRRDGVDGSGAEVGEQVEGSFLEEEMVDGGVLRRGAAGASSG